MRGTWRGRALLAGGEPPAGLRWNSSFAFNGFKARAAIPVSQTGLSPAMLRLAGEIADGVVLWACPASYVADVVIREMAAGRSRAGRDLAGLDICAAVPNAVVDDPPSPSAASGRAAPLLRPALYRAMFAQAGYEADIAAYEPRPTSRPTRRDQRRVYRGPLRHRGNRADVAAGVARMVPRAPPTR